MKKLLLSAIVGVTVLSAATQIKSNISDCTSCHGLSFERKALGVSKVVKDMSLDEIETALEGYKNLTYGGQLRNIMNAQLNKVKDIKKIARSVYEVNHKAEEKKTKEIVQNFDYLHNKQFAQKKNALIDAGTDYVSCVKDASQYKQVKQCDNILEKMKSIEEAMNTPGRKTR